MLRREGTLTLPGKKRGINVQEAKDNCPNPPPNNKYVYAYAVLNATPNYYPVPLAPVSNGGGGGGTGRS